MKIVLKIFLLILILILIFLNWERIFDFLKNLWQKIEIALKKRVEETKKIIEGIKIKEELQKLEKNITDKIRDKLKELIK